MRHSLFNPFMNWQMDRRCFMGDPTPSDPPSDPDPSPPPATPAASTPNTYDNYYEAIDAEGVGAEVIINGQTVRAETADGYTGTPQPSEPVTFTTIDLNTGNQTEVATIDYGSNGVSVSFPDDDPSPPPPPPPASVDTSSLSGVLEASGDLGVENDAGTTLTVGNNGDYYITNPDGTKMNVGSDLATARTRQEERNEILTSPPPASPPPSPPASTRSGRNLDADLGIGGSNETVTADDLASGTGTVTIPTGTGSVTVADDSDYATSGSTGMDILTGGFPDDPPSLPTGPSGMPSLDAYIDSFGAMGDIIGTDTIIQGYINAGGTVTDADLEAFGGAGDDVDTGTGGRDLDADLGIGGTSTSTTPPPSPPASPPPATVDTSTLQGVLDASGGDTTIDTVGRDLDADLGIGGTATSTTPPPSPPPAVDTSTLQGVLDASGGDTTIDTVGRDLDADLGIGGSEDTVTAEDLATGTGTITTQTDTGGSVTVAAPPPDQPVYTDVNGNQFATIQEMNASNQRILAAIAADTANLQKASYTQTDTGGGTRIGDIDPNTVGVYGGGAQQTSTGGDTRTRSYAEIMGLTDSEADEMRSKIGTSDEAAFDVLNPFGGAGTPPPSDTMGNIVAGGAADTLALIGSAAESLGTTLMPQSEAGIGYGEGQVDPALAQAAGAAQGADTIAYGAESGLTTAGREMKEAGQRLSDRVTGNLSTETQEALATPIWEDGTMNTEALSAKLQRGLLPFGASVSGLAINLPAAMITGGLSTMGEVGQASDALVQQAYDSGDLGEMSSEQLQAVKNSVRENTAAVSAGAGTVGAALPFGAGTIPGRIGLAAGEEAFQEGVIEPNIATVGTDVTAGTDYGLTADADAATLGAILGPIGAAGGTATTTTRQATGGTQGPDVQTTGPAQPLTPGGGTAADVITGASLTRGPDDGLRGTAVTTPSAPQGPQVPTTTSPQGPNIVTIPGTDVSVQIPAPAQPQLPAPETGGLGSLGTGGAFQVPNLSTSAPALPAPQDIEDAVEVDTTPFQLTPEMRVSDAEETLMSQPVEQTTDLTAFDIINNEIQETGSLSMDTAAQIAEDNNMSMQEVSNMAEGIMGLTPSTATGPSTEVALPSTPTPVSVPVDQGVEVMIPSDPATDAETYMFEGEILGPDTFVSTDVAPETEGVTIEGETVSTEVSVPADTAPPSTTPPAQPPADTTPSTVTTTTPAFVDTVPPDDEPEVEVEVDEPSPPAEPEGPSGPGEPEEVEVEVGVDTDTDDQDEEVEEPPFECPDGYEAVQINGEWRCQSTGELPEKMRPTGGSYYQPRKPSPAASAQAYRFRR